MKTMQHTEEVLKIYFLISDSAVYQGGIGWLNVRKQLIKFLINSELFILKEFYLLFQDVYEL